ncbi:MAG: peptidylprolyl isomerase [Cocleimonas sp.]
MKIVLSSLLISLLFSANTNADDIALDRIAAIVNSDVIMTSELRSSLARIKQSNKTTLTGQALVKEVLEKLILAKIQVQRAKALGIKIDDVAVNSAMQTVAKQNNLNLEHFREALIREGFNYKDFRESIRETLYKDTLRKRRQSRSKKITETKVDDLIQAESLTINKDVHYHIIDIMIANNNATSVKSFNANLLKTQQLRTSLLSQKKLSTSMLKKFGANSNDLGWRASNTLSPAFVRSLSLMEEGQLSSVVRDQRGFHILKLIEQRGGKRKLTQEVRARHILIPLDTPNGRLKATQLRNKILAGESFDTLAKAHSADKGSAVKGGKLDMVNPAAYVPPFAKAVSSLPLNTLSQPIQTKFGWHLIEVLERQTSDQTRQAIKLQAQSLLSEKKQTEDHKNWLQSLRDAAFVEYKI